ncbi:beta-galactosidase [Asanoa sp. NPDC049573]|uniref:beta-galactosidase n=1 Tax=Asanoa sp. NPDC049573 TaxID=3155396 RepID=UPI0034127213
MTWTSAMGRALVTAGAAALAVPALTELRIAPSTRALTRRWREVPVGRRGNTALGISFRPRQCEDFDLDPRETLTTLLSYPFDLVRLSAYWDRIEPEPGEFDTDEVDWQLEAAERAGKRVVMCLGPIKSFGYPEYFVPGHLLDEALPEGRLVDPVSQPALLDAATRYLARMVKRYRDRESIVAWQIEHEAVDPLGLEHSWRLAQTFLRHEVATVRANDPARPIVLNGFLPTSTIVLAHQWWRTRDQGDSVAAAEQIADIVGIDSYARYAVTSVGRWSVYLDGSTGVLPALRRRRLLATVAATGRKVMVTEGQAEPWEAVTVPPSPTARAASSCPPERIIKNYNDWLRWASQARTELSAYLFWGAEYWVMRDRQGDSSYLDAFTRLLEQS